MKTLRGFTLVELVIVIALAGLVAVMISVVLSRPMEGFVAQSRRAELVDLAAGALNRMARDVRLSVPNSLRVSSDGKALELLLIHSPADATKRSGAARYRPNRLDSDGLRFSIGPAADCGSTVAGGACDALEVLDPNFDPAGAKWMVLYNIGAESGGNPMPGASVWAFANPGVITPTGASFKAQTGAAPAETQIVVEGLSNDFRFAFSSPQRRLYFAETVVGYRCLDGGRLVRYSYDRLLSAVPQAPPSDSNPQPLAHSVTRCIFDYQPGTTQRAGLLSMTLGIAQNDETLQLLQQVHVDNAP